MIANQDWPTENITNMLPFLKLFVALHVGIDLLGHLVKEHNRDKLNLVRMIRLVYIRKKCDWLGGPEKKPFSTANFWGSSGNVDIRSYGVCMMWFFLNFDPTFYSKYIPNFREVSTNFVDYINKMVDIFGF